MMEPDGFRPYVEFNVLSQPTNDRETENDAQ